MNTKTLQQYLYDQIPLSSALGIVVQKATEREVILEAPLLPNINHKKTVFGGSLHSVATLACWGLVYINLKKLNFPTEIVISQSNIKYIHAVTDNFRAICCLENSEEFLRFENVLNRKRKARIKLRALINQGEKIAVDYEGEFVALRG